MSIFLHSGFKVGSRSLIFGLFFGLALLGAPSVAAAEEEGFRITPVHQDLQTLIPGQTYSGSFEVQNSTSAAIKMTFQVAPYQVLDSNYQPDFDNPSASTELANWVQLSAAVAELTPGSAYTFTYTIAVPRDAPSGHQSAAIIVAAENPDTAADANVSVTSRIAFTLYGNVAGETREQFTILENHIPLLLFDSPVAADSLVSNTGNVNLTVNYLFEVRNLFGDQLVYTNANEDTLNQHVVFPDTERANHISWLGTPALGLYKVTQTVSFRDQISTAERIVLVCPIWFAVVILVFVALVVFEIVSFFRRRARRRRNLF